MKKLLLVLLFSPLFFTICHAEGLSGQAADLTGIYAAEDSLTPEEREIGGRLRLDGSYDHEGALRRLWQSLREKLGESLRGELGPVASLAGLAVFSSLACVFTQSSGIKAVVNLAACCAAALLTVGSVDSLTHQCTDALARLSDYSRAVLPALFTAAAAGGAVVSASARYAVACFAMEAMMGLSQRLILPLIYGCLAMSISVSIYQSPLLRSILNLGKKLCMLTMTLMSMGFTALLGLVGVVSQSADAAAARAVGTAIKFALPVVGRLMTDAAASVISAAALVKNSVGVFGLVAVCALCLSPFAMFAVRRILFILLGAAAELTVGDRLSRLLGDMSALMGMLLGLIGSFGLMLFFALVAAIRTVSG